MKWTNPNDADRLSSASFARVAFSKSQQAFAAMRRKDECYQPSIGEGRTASENLVRVPRFATEAERTAFCAEHALFSPLYDGVKLPGCNWTFGRARAEVFRTGGVREVLALMSER